MIQFNLLPDVKQQYIRAARMKRTAIVIAFLVTASSLFIFIMLFLSVHVFQKNTLDDLSSSIKSKTAELESKPDLDKVLTIQNQLNSLPDLHDQKPVTSRLFTYVAQVTPAQVSIGKIDLDYGTKTISIVGNADSLSTVNKFIDTLKFTTYSVPAEATSPGAESTSKPFSSVVLSSFSRNDKEATYAIALSYDPTIFDSSKNIVLTVPKIISTRSETEKPTELFKALPEKKQ